MNNQFIELLKGIESILTIIGLLIGGGWAIWKFILVKETSPKLEFKVDVNFVGKHKEEWLIEILGLLENKGVVPYKISYLTFDTKYLLNDDELNENAKYNDQIDIKNELKTNTWLASVKDIKPTIYPDTSMRFNYIYKVPVGASFILIHGLLVFSKGLEVRADKLVRVPDELQVFEKS